jgi:hypothetical protein
VVSSILQSRTSLEVLEFDPALRANRVVGWGFYEEGTPGQHHWMLLPGHHAPPRGLVTLRPPADPERRFTTLAAWFGAARQRWEPGSTFVRGRVRFRDEIPEDLVSPTPLRSGETTSTAGVVDLDLDLCVGRVFSVEGSPRQLCTEYWVLGPQYRPAPVACLDVVEIPGARHYRDASSFLADRRAEWASGSTLAVVESEVFSALPSKLPALASA